MNYASHDPAACIVSDNNGKLEYITIAEERLSRVKYSYFFPVRSIKYCMDYFGIESMDKIDYLFIDYGFSQQVNNTTKNYRKLESDYIKTRLNINFSKTKYVDHHLAHAASAFYPSNFDDAAILVVDGFGSNVETNSLFTGSYKDGIKLIDRAYGQGIGIVYTEVTNQILGFGIGEEGKTMGLAPLGRDVAGENILRLNPDYDGIITDYSNFIDRAPCSWIKQEIAKCESKADVTNDFYSKIAFELQQETEKCMLHLAQYAYETTKKKKLCIAGGVGLNCVANDVLLENTLFEEIFFQPASSDCGVPLGLCLYGYYKEKKSKEKVSFSVYSSKSYEKREGLDFLNSTGIKYCDAKPDKVAMLISQKNVVGWFSGGSELGPRALGNRCILADPRYIETKDLINSKVKHREMYRPFAPSILVEHSKEYFHLKNDSPYMMLAPLIRKDKTNEIPAVVHIDGTGRVQTVEKKDNPLYYELIDKFREITGVPVILNTSFNDNNEPIVETPLDALLCFLRTNIDYLYLDGVLIKKSEILDKNKLIDKLEQLRSNKLRQSYEETINVICENYNTEEMQTYMKKYYPMHQYYKGLHTFVALQNEICNQIERVDYFVTDEYHLEIIKEFMKEEHYLITSRLKVLTVEDNRLSLPKVPQNSFVLLYNMSLYFKDNNVYNFYKLEYIKLKPLWGAGDFNNNFSISNEYNSSKNWDKFYNEHVINYQASKC